MEVRDAGSHGEPTAIGEHQWTRAAADLGDRAVPLVPRCESAIIPAVDASRSAEFVPGDQVVLIEDGTHAVVRWSKEGYCAVNWLDEDPDEFGGSVVANARLRLVHAADS